MKLIRIERIGILLIIIFTFLLSNLYILTDFSPFKIICAGSNSIMEQMKVFYFSVFVFMIIEMFFKIQYNNNFFMAKAISVYFFVFSVPMLFYLIKNMFGIMNIIIYVFIIIISATMCQFFSYKILLDEEYDGIKFKLLSIFSLLLLGSLLVYFSLNPLGTPIFMTS